MKFNDYWALPSGAYKLQRLLIAVLKLEKYKAKGIEALEK